MNRNELKSLLEWLKKIGVVNFGQLRYLQVIYRLKTNADLLDFVNGCVVHQIKFIDL